MATVEINSANETEVSLEQEAQLQEKAQQETEQPTQETKQEEQRPEWLPEKFKNAEDLAKAYSELEKKMSTNEPKEEVKAEQEQTGYISKYYDEFSETGAISENSYKELDKMGLSKELVDGYIAGQKAIADTEVQTIHNSIGGSENYNKILDWAKGNLNEAEVEAFNTTLDNGSIEQVKFAVQAIASRAGVSTEPKQSMFVGDTINVGGDVFESIAQVTEAISNPKYDKDPAYRKQVEDKISRSSII
jgi:hypothetical protein